MFRISKSEGRWGTVVTIDGELLADGVEAVENCCREALAAGRRVDLFLREVSRFDEAGRGLLRRLAAAGVRLVASGVYTSYLVKAFDPATRSSREPPVGTKRQERRASGR